MSSSELDIEFPEKLECLFKPSRYKILHGGRGGAKSWGVARALLILGVTNPLRILCTREFQNSIRDSVHKLLSDQIHALGLSGFYDVQNAYIKGANGTEFSFDGLRHNAAKLKSYEGVDICWVEEGQSVSKGSWEILIPTIRKANSEIWVTLNPQLETDETYQRFIVNPPPNSQVVKINWSDNPWFPETLDAERKHLQGKDPDAYLNIWEGNCRIALDGAIYANELRVATQEGRITNVPYDLSKPVDTFWDLGRADKTSIIMAQVIGFEFRVIDYYENRHHHISHYVQELQKRPYVWGTDYLPHDANNEQLAAQRTIKQQLEEMGRRVTVVPKVSIADGINAGRTIFPRCWIDQKKADDLIQALRHYRYEVDPDTNQVSKNPLHDDYSHAADAWRYMALSLTESRQRVEKIRYKNRYIA